MKQLSIAVIGGDERALKLSDFLEKDGHKVFKSIKTDDISAAEAVYNSDIVILPVPCTKDGKSINSPLKSTDTVVDENFVSAVSGKRVFAGMAEKLSDKLSDIYDYANREDFLMLNAQATAECAIAYAINEISNPLFNLSCLVVGYGRIGKALSKLLYAFGAKVCVCARRSEHKSMACCNGYDYAEYNELGDKIKNFDLIFNTVPALVLNSDVISRMNKAATIIDLASGGGGTDFSAAKENGVKAFHALSLPGKYYPDGSALDIKNTIYSILKEDDCK